MSCSFTITKQPSLQSNNILTMMWQKWRKQILQTTSSNEGCIPLSLKKMKFKTYKGNINAWNVENTYFISRMFIMWSDIWNEKWYMKHFIYWTADLKSSKPWSSQFWTQFKQLRTEAWKNEKWPAPNVSGFIAQLVRASHRYREVTGSNPVEALTFSGFCSQLLKLRWSWPT